MGLLLVVGVVLIVTSLILTCLVMGLPFWIVYDGVFYGLWDICISLAGHIHVCRSYLEGFPTYDYLEATRAMVCCCLILVTLATLFSCLLFCCRGHNMVLRMAAVICCFLGAIFMMIGTIVYGVMFDDNNSLSISDLSASYWLTIFIIVFLIIAGVILIISRPRPKSVTF